MGKPRRNAIASRQSRLSRRYSGREGIATTHAASLPAHARRRVSATPPRRSVQCARMCACHSACVRRRCDRGSASPSVARPCTFSPNSAASAALPPLAALAPAPPLALAVAPLLASCATAPARAPANPPATALHDERRAPRHGSRAASTIVLYWHLVAAAASRGRRSGAGRRRAAAAAGAASTRVRLAARATCAVRPRGCQWPLTSSRSSAVYCMRGRQETTTAAMGEFDREEECSPLENAFELETCCICLDSLCSAPVVALLQPGGEGRRACRHFCHGRCAEKLSQNVCPVCREPFSTLSVPFGGDELVRVGAVRIVAGAQRLMGRAEEQEEDRCNSVPTRAVVELLAAVFPIRQRELEAAVQELAVCSSPRTSSLLASAQEGGEIAAAGLVRLLARCRVPLQLHGKSMDVFPQDCPLIRYSFTTRLARRLRWLALKGAGALGTGIFAGCCGAAVGVTLGAIAAIPQEQLRQRSARFVYDVIECDKRILASVVMCLATDTGRLTLPLTDLVLLLPPSRYGQVAALFFGSITLAIRMAKYGAQRGDLLLRGVLAGAAFGTGLGCVGALAIVHPNDHGFGRVFLTGLQGQTLLSMARRRLPRILGGTRDLARGPTERVDIFAPKSSTNS